MAGEGREPVEDNLSGAARQAGRDQLQEAFADLVSDMGRDLAKATLEPAVASMHESWRSEAAQLRRDTAEWISRVNASRQHMDQVVERQHELAQEVYSTHARLVQDMAAFQKERRDALLWQDQVNGQLGRLSELHRELSVESTRIAGVVRDIIGELARFQAEIEKRWEQLDNKIGTTLGEQTTALKAIVQASAESTEAALEALSKANEETRATLGRDTTALRRELQEVAARLGREMADGRSAMQESTGQRFKVLTESMRAWQSKILGFVICGELIIIAALGYMLSRML